MSRVKASWFCNSPALSSLTKQEVLMEELVALFAVVLFLYATVYIAVAVWSSIGRVAKGDKAES